MKASFKSPEGQTSEKTLVITIERVAGGGREGRPIITKITGSEVVKADFRSTVLRGVRP